MPWGIKKSGNGYVVVKKTTGETKAHFSTLARAKAYLRALYANTKGE